MTTSNIWWRRTAVASLALALSLGTAVTGVTTASAAPPVEADIRISPIRGAVPDSDDNPLGTITFDQGLQGALFAAGTTTTVTLTLSEGAVFSPDLLPTATGTGGLTVDLDETDDPADGTFTFTVTAGSIVTDAAAVTISGLTVDLAADADGNVTVTASGTVPGVNGGAPIDVEGFGDEDVALVVANTVRIGGQDRYETAAKIFREAEREAPGGFSGSVVLSGGEDFPDALSANYLAGMADTGILLTRAGFLSPESREVIIDYEIEKVYITGGYGAVSKKVEDELKATHVGGHPLFGPFIQVIRLDGADRYATNKKINQYTVDVFDGNPDTSLIATGRGFADALALGPIAYRQNFPIILTPGQTSLGALADAQLDEYDTDDLVIAGGTASISTAVAKELEDRTPGTDVTRLGGPDRTFTACEIANYADEEFDTITPGIPPTDTDPGTPDVVNQVFDFSEVALANGQFFPDALAGGPLMGVLEGPILLTKSRNVLGGGTRECLETRSADEVDRLIALGLTGALSAEVVEEAGNSIGSQDPSPVATARRLS